MLKGSRTLTKQPPVKRLPQNFSYHTHTNATGIRGFDACDHPDPGYDGVNSIRELIRQAKALGWTHMGISNHFIVHPDIRPHRCFFNDFKKAETVFKSTVETIRTVAEEEDFPVLAGFEVDYFWDPKWEKWFERFVPTLGADYLIGSTHVWGKDETGPLFFDGRNNAKAYPVEDVRANMGLYFERQKAMIRTGYFDFLAHMDVQRRYGVEDGTLFQDEKKAVIEEIKKANMPVEINTSGFGTKLEEPHPSIWILEELKKAKIPVVLSDDAHYANSLGAGFEKAEVLLERIRYPYRFNLFRKCVAKGRIHGSDGKTNDID